MNTRRRKNLEDPLDRARSALSLLSEPIHHGDLRGDAGSAEDLEGGLDAMASALNDLRKKPALASPPLDIVLAEMEADDALVNTAADLIELLGQSTYAGGLGSGEAEAAETLRSRLYKGLDELLNRLQDERRDA